MRYKTIHFTTIDSTNKYLKENYQKYDNLTFVSSDFQTNGKGREDRTWISNKKENLLFSVLIKDQELINKYSSLSLLSGYVIFKVLKDLGIKEVSIKWPNDVYVSGNKICGILMESVSLDTKIEALVIGIGLNVNQEHIVCEQKTTSIRQIKQKKVFIHSIKKKVYKCLKSELSLLKENKSNYLEEVRNNNYLFNKTGFATINNQKVQIKVLDINEDNSLKVLYNNEIVNLSSGEVSFH